MSANTAAQMVKFMTEIDSLRSRLAEVEKERDEARELFKVFCDRSEFADKEAATAQAELLAAKASIAEKDAIIQDLEDPHAADLRMARATKKAFDAATRATEREK